LIVSVAALAVESIAVLAESAIDFTVSVAALAVLSALDAELPEFEQAAKAPTANTNKSFFIVIDFLLLNVNGFSLIPKSEKSNPEKKGKLNIFYFNT